METSLSGAAAVVSLTRAWVVDVQATTYPPTPSTLLHPQTPFFNHWMFRLEWPLQEVVKSTQEVCTGLILDGARLQVAQRTGREP